MTHSSNLVIRRLIRCLHNILLAVLGLLAAFFGGVIGILIFLLIHRGAEYLAILFVPKDKWPVVWCDEHSNDCWTYLPLIFEIPSWCIGGAFSALLWMLFAGIIVKPDSFYTHKLSNLILWLIYACGCAVAVLLEGYGSKRETVYLMFTFFSGFCTTVVLTRTYALTEKKL